MALLSRSPAARTALIYVTLGTLTVIWSVVWLIYLMNSPPAERALYYLCGGLVITGVALTLLGLGLGQLGRSARKAELPPPEVTSAMANAEQAAAAQPVLLPTPNGAAIPVSQPPTTVSTTVSAR